MVVGTTIDKAACCTGTYPGRDTCDDYKPGNHEKCDNVVTKFCNDNYNHEICSCISRTNLKTDNYKEYNKIKKTVDANFKEYPLPDVCWYSGCANTNSYMNNIDFNNKKTCPKEVNICKMDNININGGLTVDIANKCGTTNNPSVPIDETTRQKNLKDEKARKLGILVLIMVAILIIIVVFIFILAPKM